jgi:hypothetical protein
MYLKQYTPDIETGDKEVIENEDEHDSLLGGKKE